ncbi:VOC family protein [Staphylococcus hominis]|uniref:VOC family protein n=1 Tax=Staphylococcus hominis TaxID=1290 RepID=UPI00066E4DCC|nr:VOC family protein [Staphylococcus hominis]MCE4990270.1 VOC family protein [Staphylococcus hominis]MCI2913614.1 VOC family protein [Staphylococcus hominis]MDS3905419.1 VOC family protein [Staphylococcus hominis]MDS3909203.1 VOC family protein [Staphylococcus hominis]
MKLKFDHMIHYVDQLKGFKYPGELLKIHSGGKHHQYGTFNRLTYINGNYIELLDVENVEKLKKEAKTEKGRVAFATKIVQDNFKQGFKTMAFRTEDIERVKQSLNERHIDTIGPINMDRENKKGEKIRWKLLYIADPDYMVRPPFFIEWNKNNVDYMQDLDSFFQKQFKIDKIIIDSSKRSKTLTKWQTWFNMDIIEENENYTDLKLEGDTIVYRIQDAAQSGYNTIIFKDNETTTPYSIIIKGAKYRFEPNEGTN